MLDRQTLQRAFRALGERLARRGVVGELYVFGGAALVLAFDGRTATRDVDALFLPDTDVLESAWEVARELDLPASWLNNQASVYVSGVAGRGTPVFDHPNLRVMVTSPEHLLAMKVRASRSTRDAEDIRLLLDHLQVQDLGGIVEIVDRFFPGEPLSDRSRMLVEDVLDQQPPHA